MIWTVSFDVLSYLQLITQATIQLILPRTRLLVVIQVGDCYSYFARHVWSSNFAWAGYIFKNFASGYWLKVSCVFVVCIKFNTCNCYQQKSEACTLEQVKHYRNFVFLWNRSSWFVIKSINFILKELKNLNKVLPIGYGYLSFPDAAFYMRGQVIKERRKM